ncbi:hypothetical protein B9Z55_025173 [Caenorhabditis nigoni]|uniref:G-protein coupled receptors family 1 profile domain-containing protein n=1 Tax=Caenorhabditis nigoni TaxID=1611254 RepID=A0A2G5SXN7_9PELO|nr:hypothetical protein B9Z55_025173 [Caenorhabditis nigoni]
MYLFAWSSRIFQWKVIFFQPLLNNFIVLLAVQRFVFIFLPEKAHFLAKRRATRIYIIIIWIVSMLFGALICMILYGVTINRAIQSSQRFFNRLSYFTFASLAFVSSIYFSIFIHLYKMPRNNNWNRPEIALLYEGVPLLLTNIFILCYIQFDVEGRELHDWYINYGMRKIVISTALVQFTSVFTFQRIVFFFSTDFRVLLNRSSIIRPMNIVT